MAADGNDNNAMAFATAIASRMTSPRVFPDGNHSPAKSQRLAPIRKRQRFCTNIPSRNSRITASTARAVARLGRDSRQAADGNPLGIRTLELLSLIRFSSATSS